MRSRSPRKSSGFHSLDGGENGKKTFTRGNVKKQSACMHWLVSLVGPNYLTDFYFYFFTFYLSM